VLRWRKTATHDEKTAPRAKDQSGLPTPVLRAPAASGVATLAPPVEDRLSVVAKLGPTPVPEASTLKYKVERPLSAGGMGLVCVAQDLDIGRQVAMKTLLPEFAGESTLVKRFVQEAQIVGRLDHPNVVPVHDFGLNASGQPYFTMKLVRGSTLGGVIRDLKEGNAAAHAHYSFTRRLQLMLAICEAIAYAHAQRIIHRDLKPDNIMLGPYGEVFVMDWGLAKSLDAADLPLKRTTRKEPVAGPLRQDGSTSLTMEGDVLGTPSYMPPEQAQGRTADLDERCDVYALGALAYVLFTLERPCGATPDAPPPGPDSVKSPHQGRVPREIHNEIVKAMQPDRERRHRSVRELADALQACLEGRNAVSCPVTALKRGTMAFGRFVDNHGVPLVMSMMAVIISLVVVLLRGLGRGM